MTERYLITGGAGYVGSHLVAVLADRGAEIVVLDNLRQGHRGAVPNGVDLIVGDVGDRTLLDNVFSANAFDAVFHFAALSLVGESMQHPFRYLEQNAINGIRLIEACVHHRVGRFVFSSTANLFGTPTEVPIPEDADVDPGSPYGESKRMIERALLWAERVHGLRSACLRYFNAAGADPNGRLGEDHDPETHLIPLVIDAALGRRPELVIFGNDYDTVDGTCVRDYVHVTDLAEAHIQALATLNQKSVVYNLGNGAGHSVLQVIQCVERVTGLTVPTRFGERRPGDPPILVASSARISRETDWKPRFSALDDIVRTAYTWRKAHPNGYDC